MQSYRIRCDPSLILYYTFDPSDPLYKSILNRSGATAGRLDAYPGDALDPTSRPMRMPSGRWPAQRSLRFDSSRRQHLRVAHANELNITQSVSLAAWIRPTLPLLEPRAVIVSKTSSTPSARKPNYEIGLRRDTSPDSGNGCMLYFQAGDQEIVTPDIAIVPGQWIFVAAVASSEATSLFVNGIRVAQMDSVKLIPNQGDLWIGGVSDTVQPGSEGNYFEGAIGELMLFRRTLTDVEIMTDFRSEMGPA